MSAMTRTPRVIYKSIERLNDAVTELRQFTPDDYDTAQLMRSVFQQLKEEATRYELAMSNMVESARALRLAHYTSVSAFYPHPIARCGFCERPIYAHPAPVDPTASLCDSCHTQLTALILAAPMLSNAILSALRLQGALK